MWFNETLASGMVPYHHIIGGENGLGEDRRWLEPAHKYFDWMAKHDQHFVNKRSIANIGVVMGQRTHLFYRPPNRSLMREYMRRGPSPEAEWRSQTAAERARGPPIHRGPGIGVSAPSSQYGNPFRPSSRDRVHRDGRRLMPVYAIRRTSPFEPPAMLCRSGA